mmetsp:Transcript_47415/g.94619  ORF Transcript_47415/g.94619 Transcript_47415/m.94619 type:complete len:102 (-) Transcript_47415:1343-1648(-)
MKAVVVLQYGVDEASQGATAASPTVPGSSVPVTANNGATSCAAPGPLVPVTACRGDSPCAISSAVDASLTTDDADGLLAKGEGLNADGEQPTDWLSVEGER